jgi:two-component system, chemotaxis family, protein-glutamate methylesterase/glutaminase
MSDANANPIRVVVIDDSAFNRQTITSMLESDAGIRVVGRAGDGDEGLKQVLIHNPDVVTLDLEMPKMDGFTFLRILMSRRPTPVIVISSYARKDNVFRALELGALDFIAKPTEKISPELRDIERDLVEKVHVVTRLRVVSLVERAYPRARTQPPTPAPPAEAVPERVAPGTDRTERTERIERPDRGALRKVVCIGASTGGPPALSQIFAELDARLPMAVLVAQHMPAKFTQAFAERLDRSSAFEVREAKHGDLVRPGLALVAPGAGIMSVVRGTDGLRVRIDPPGPEDRFVPSIDRLFESCAEAVGPDTIGVVLTGMGGDGGRGILAIHNRGGYGIAEAAETAIIFGMPEEAIRTGAIDEVLPLPQIVMAITSRVRARTSSQFSP